MQKLDCTLSGLIPLLLVEGFRLFLLTLLSFGVFGLLFFEADVLFADVAGACALRRCRLAAEALAEEQLQGRALEHGGLALMRMPSQHGCHTVGIYCFFPAGASDRSLLWRVETSDPCFGCA